MADLQEFLATLEPGAALAVLTPHLKKILGHLDDEARAAFVGEVLGGQGDDKVASLVDL